MTNNKLSEDDCRKLFDTVHDEMLEHPCLRFGQSLFNNLPKEVRDQICGTDLDFFYDKDVSVVIYKFFKSGITESN